MPKSKGKHLKNQLDTVCVSPCFARANYRTLCTLNVSSGFGPWDIYFSVSSATGKYYLSIIGGSSVASFAGLSIPILTKLEEHIGTWFTTRELRSGCSQPVCLHWLTKIVASLVGWYSRDELWHVKFCRKAWEGKGTSSKKQLGRDLKSCGSKRLHWNLSWRLQQVPESAGLCFHVWKSQKILSPSSYSPCC